jgi:ABC-type bacteriocin/lantibiotic exporter with double-glycine peptidase domain
MLPLISFRQRRNYDCGPASLNIVLSHEGKSVNYENLLKLTRVRERDGLHGHLMAKTLTKYGLSGGYYEFCSLSGLRELYKQDIPVIVGWFMPRFGVPGNHWSVIQSVGKRYVYMMDPGIGKTRRLSQADFEALWFTIDTSATKRGMMRSPLAYVGMREVVIPYAEKYEHLITMAPATIKKIGRVGELKKKPSELPVSADEVR